MGEWGAGVRAGFRVFGVEITTKRYDVMKIYESDETRVYTAAWRAPGIAVLSEGGGGVQGDVQIL
jgi:hypothetical protein